jgi:hypothetical protein
VSEDPPHAERRADIDAFVDEQLADLDLPELLDAHLRRRIRDLALGRADIRVPDPPPAGSPV